MKEQGTPLRNAINPTSSRRLPKSCLQRLGQDPPVVGLAGSARTSDPAVERTGIQVRVHSIPAGTGEPDRQAEGMAAAALAALRQAHTPEEEAAEEGPEHNRPMTDHRLNWVVHPVPGAHRSGNVRRPCAIVLPPSCVASSLFEFP